VTDLERVIQSKEALPTSYLTNAVFLYVKSSDDTEIRVQGLNRICPETLKVIVNMFLPQNVMVMKVEIVEINEKPFLSDYTNMYVGILHFYVHNTHRLLLLNLHPSIWI